MPKNPELESETSDMNDSLQIPMMPTQAQIAALAKTLSKQSGRKEWELEHWFQAERLLIKKMAAEAIEQASSESAPSNVGRKRSSGG